MKNNISSYIPKTFYMYLYLDFGKIKKYSLRTHYCFEYKWVRWIKIWKDEIFAWHWALIIY